MTKKMNCCQQSTIKTELFFKHKNHSLFCFNEVYLVAFRICHLVCNEKCYLELLNFLHNYKVRMNNNRFSYHKNIFIEKINEEFTYSLQNINVYSCCKFHLFHWNNSMTNYFSTNIYRAYNPYKKNNDELNPNIICDKCTLNFIQSLFATKPALYSIFDTRKHFFTECCKMNLPKTTKYLLTKINSFETETLFNSFVYLLIEAFKLGNIHIAKLLFAELSKNKKNMITFNKQYSITSIFTNVCKNAHLILAKWILKQPLFAKIIETHNCNNCFLDVCCRGYLSMAKWLFSVIPNLDINNRNCFAFISSCHNGYLHIAKWILKLNPATNIYTSNFDNNDDGNNVVVKYSAEYQQLNIAKYLLQQNPNKFFGNIVMKFVDDYRGKIKKLQLTKTVIYNKKQQIAKIV